VLQPSVRAILSAYSDANHTLLNITYIDFYFSSPPHTGVPAPIARYAAEHRSQFPAATNLNGYFCPVHRITGVASAQDTGLGNPPPPVAKSRPMNTKPLLALIALAILLVVASRPYSAPALAPQAPSNSNAPSYTSAGELRFPEHYREWVYLSTGFDMSYNPAMNMDHHMFDNVFVNPEAYHSFLQTGTWPDKTIFVLEARGAESKGSINQAGQYQGSSVMGLEVHLKDESRFPGKWAFFGFDEGQLGKIFPTTASCYSCHQQHAAVDTTFVQFYPTLLPISTAKHTLSDAYTKESAATDKPDHH